MMDFFNNQRILDIIWKRKFHFIIIGIAAIVISAVFSGPNFITPKYKSSARIYPTNNVFTLSDESETEQMLEIVNSRDIKLRMFDAFNLPEAYEIDKGSPHYLTYMIEIYNSNVSAKKTEFETVEITVVDEDPKRASEMCDSIILFYNDKIGKMHSMKYHEVADIAKYFSRQKQIELDSISEKLQLTRDESNIISYSQIEKVTEGYMDMLASNASRTADGQVIKKQYEQLAKNGIDVYTLERRFSKLSSIVDSLNLAHDVAIIEATKDITYCHVVEAPIPADKKSYPVRWLIVAVSLMATLFVALIFFLILDYKKQ